MPLSKGEPLGVGEVESRPVEAAKVIDPTPVKTYLTTHTKVKAADLSKQAWGNPEDIIASAVKFHGGTIEGYQNSGLG